MDMTPTQMVQQSGSSPSKKRPLDAAEQRGAYAIVADKNPHKLEDLQKMRRAAGRVCEDWLRELGAIGPARS